MNSSNLYYIGSRINDFRAMIWSGGSWDREDSLEENEGSVGEEHDERQDLNLSPVSSMRYEQCVLGGLLMNREKEWHFQNLYIGWGVAQDGFDTNEPFLGVIVWRTVFDVMSCPTDLVCSAS